MSRSWLQHKRKPELIDLSEQAGLELGDDLRKDDIVENLDSFLQQNATRLSRNMAFQPYYGSGPRQTPGKARSSSTMGGVTSDDGDVKSAVKGRGRRSTKVKEEFGNDTGASSPDAGPSTSTTLVRPRSSTTAQLPPSPADVANLAEYESSQFVAGLNDFYTVSGIPELIQTVRETCSSVTGVQLFFQLLEATGLQCLTLPWNWVFDITFLRPLGIRSIPIYVPDLFELLTNRFWLPTLLYTLTAILVPGIFAYFFNLTTRTVKRGGARVSVARYAVDPLIFNVVKAIATYVVYARFMGADRLWDARVVEDTNLTLFGGYQGVLVGCYVVILASLYEAAQRRP